MTASNPGARTRPRGRVAALALTFATVAASLGFAARPATGATANTPTSAPASETGSGVDLALDGVPPWVPVGGVVGLHVRVTGGADDLLMRVSVHQAISSRTAFADIIGGTDPGSVLDAVSFPVTDLHGAPGGDQAINIHLRAPQAPHALDRLDVVHTGVYPMTISLSPPNGDPVASVSTWLVVAAQPLDTRLSFAWVWQLVNAPLTSRNRAQVAAALQPAGRLGRAASALGLADGVPLSLVLGPETFETWKTVAKHDAAAADGLALVQNAVADQNDRQVLAMPYVPLDLPSVAAAGLSDSVLGDLRLGEDAIETTLGVLPDPGTVLLDPVDARAIAVAHDALAARFVVRDDALRPVENVLTPSRLLRVNAGGNQWTVATSNAFVDSLLTGTGSRAERAQRFLAGLSLIALEAPSDARGIVVATPQSWDPDPRLVALVLKGLRSHPFIAPRTLDGFYANVPLDRDPKGQLLVTSLQPIRPHAPTVTATQLDDARRALASFRSLVGNADPRVAQGSHSILIASSSMLTRAEGAHELATIDVAAQGFLSSISTTPRTITLTSRTARIPLSFTNKTGQTVRVKVHLASAKLRFPEGADQILQLPPKNTTQRFLVEARTSGTFTMRVTLTTADDQFTIQSTEMIVRSTVFSGIGVYLTAGALLFLAFWWGNHIWRSRRARRRTPPEPALT